MNASVESFCASANVMMEPIIIAKIMKTPPVVGVPSFLACVSGAKSFMYWPIVFLRKKSMYGTPNNKHNISPNKNATASIIIAVPLFLSFQLYLQISSNVMPLKVL